MGRAKTIALLGVTVLFAGGILLFLSPGRTPTLPGPGEAQEASRVPGALPGEGPASSPSRPEGETPSLSPASRKSIPPEAAWRAALAGIQGRILWADGSPAGGLTVEAYQGWNGLPPVFAPREDLPPGPPPGSLDSFDSQMNFLDYVAYYFPDPSDVRPLAFLEFHKFLFPPASRALTKGDGGFRLLGLSMDRPLLLAAKKGSRTLATFLPSVHLKGGKTAALGDLGLPPFRKIAGKVMDQEGSPLPGAEIKAFHTEREAYALEGILRKDLDWALEMLDICPPNPPSVRHLLPKSNRISSLFNLPSSRTDAGGFFHLSFVPGDFKFVVARAEGYRPSRPARVPSRPEGKPPHLVFRLARETSFSVKVEDERGRPAEGVEVMAAFTSAFQEEAPLRREGRTGSDGKIVCRGPWKERLFLALRRNKSEPWSVHGPWIKGDSPVVKLRKPRDYTCIFKSRPGNRPLLPDKSFITYFGDDKALPLSIRMIPPSTLVMEKIPWGYYLLHAEKEGFFPGVAELIVPKDVSSLSDKQTVTLWKKESLPVETRDSKGRPVPGARILCESRAPEKLDHTQVLSGPVLTDGRGRASMEAIEGGKLSFTVFKKGFSPMVDFEVKRAGHSPIVLSLEKPGRVEGKVLGLPQNKVHRGLRALLFQEGPFFDSAPVDPEGKFSFEGVPPGSYSILLWIRGSGILLSDFLHMHEDIEREENLIEVEEGATTRATLEYPFPKGPGTVFGKVTANARPLAEALVLLSFPGLRKWRFLPIPSPCRTDRTGRFSIEGVPAGEYLLQVSAPIGNGRGRRIVLMEESITVRGGEKLHVDMDYPGASVAGVVLDRKGTPFPSLKILFERDLSQLDSGVNPPAPGLSPFRETWTDSSGKFYIFPISPGRWNLSFLDSFCIPFRKYSIDLDRGDVKTIEIRAARAFPVRLDYSNPSGILDPIVAVNFLPLQGQPPGPYEDNLQHVGAFHQVYLPSGKFRVQVWTMKNNKLLVWEGAITARPGLLKPIRVLLQHPWDPLEKWGSVYSGRVLDGETRKGIQGTLILAVHPDKWVFQDILKKLIFRVKTGKNGEFSLKILPGKSEFLFRKNGEAYSPRIGFWHHIPLKDGKKDILLLRKY